MDCSIEEHQKALIDAFVAVLAAEDEERRAEAAIKEVKETHTSTIRAAQQRQEEGWKAIANLMAQTGEVEVVLPDENHDFKIGYSTTPEVAEVPDVNAVPDEFCKIERTAKKKEILDHLKSLREDGQPLPNWATIKRNPGRLGYRLIKKGEA